jgi:hypothetical protein
VDHLIADILEIEIEGGGSDVALAVPVGAHDSVQSADHHVVADVELAPFVEQRGFEIFLNDESFCGAVRMLLFLFQVVV